VVKSISITGSVGVCSEIACSEILALSETYCLRSKYSTEATIYDTKINIV